MPITDAEYARMAEQTANEVLHRKIEDPANGGQLTKVYFMLEYARDDAHQANVKAGQALAAVQGIAATIPAVAGTAVHDYLTDNPPAVVIDYAALAKAVNDDRDARDRDGNPATGSVS